MCIAVFWKGLFSLFAGIKKCPGSSCLFFFFVIVVFFSSGGVGEPEDKLAAGVSALGVKIFSEDLRDRNHEQNMT